MLPAFDSGEDTFWIGRPNEGFWVGIGIGNEAVDGELQVDDGLEYAALEPLPGEPGKPTFDCIGPGAGSWGEVEGEALVPLQPGRNPRFREGSLLGCLWVA